MRRGISEVTITEEWILEQFDRQGGRCFYTGIRMVPSSAVRGLFKPSLDRRDSSRGYTPDNVVLVCAATNLAKGTSSEEDFATWVQELRAAA